MHARFYLISILLSLIALALFLSASFSLCETALLSARRHSLQARAGKGNRGARAALALQEDKDSMLATILLWNNFANVSIAFLAALLAVRLFTDDNTVLSITSVITTLTILIFAEIMPKMIGVRFAEGCACFAAPILLLLVKVLPVGKVVRATVVLGRKLINGGQEARPIDTTQLVAVNEVLAFIHDKNTLADVSAKQKALLYRMISLHDVSLRDLMVSRPELDYLDLEDPLAKMEAQLKNSKHHILPLCEDGLDNVIGILRVRELFQELHEKSLAVTKDILRKYAADPIYLPETIEPDQALQQLVGEKRQTGLVVDEYGGLIGMVTQAEFFNYLFSRKAAADSQTADAPLVVDGDDQVREVNLNLGLALPEEQAKTVAGLLIEANDHNFPAISFKQRFDDVELEVVSVKGQDIKDVAIRRLPPRRQGGA